MKAPKIATDNPKTIVGLCLRLKKYFSIKKVKMGARVPRKVALAIVVSLSDPKNNAKWIPNKKPPKVFKEVFIELTIIEKAKKPMAKEKKSFKYMVTMRWYVETDEELVPGAAETDNKILEILRHRKDGSKSCSTCPTRNNEGYSILDYHYFMGNKDPYISTELIKE